MSDEVLIKKSKSKSFLWVVIVIVLSLIVTALAYSLNVLNKEICQIRQTQDEQFNKHIETNQFLLSTIDWSSRRMKMTLFIRDQIVTEWKRAKSESNLDEAYLIAETIVRECENYSYIDPFLILATQYIESTFNKKAVSIVGAKGLNQIMPATGRLLAGYFGIAYSDSLLFDISTSTRFSVKLFDILYTQYNNWSVCLADYNGGPWQAHYYKKDKSRLAEETANFIPNVLNRKKLYDSLFIQYKVDDQMICKN